VRLESVMGLVHDVVLLALFVLDTSEGGSFTKELH
jgi:hypothetical protein